MDVIKIENLVKSYDSQPVIDGLSLSVKEGETVAITGKSGCGKSTLLNIIGLLEPFDSGDYYLFGKRNIPINSAQATKMLRENIGYLFQNYALVDDETVAYNLEMALLHSNASAAEKRELIDGALDTVGLSGFARKAVYKLSGGEQQRVAVARLILKQPGLILADEPTGSLDAVNRDIVLDLLFDLAKKTGAAVVMVTHDHQVASACSRIVEL